MAMTFDNRVAIVTGAARGLGRSYALALAARGARVAVADLAGQAEGTAEEIRNAGGIARACAVDVTDFSDVERMVADIRSAWGRVDIAISNAGNLRDRTFAKMDLADFRSVMDVHLMGSVHVSKAVWPTMREQQYGRVLLTTSSSGMYGIFGQANYASAKAAMLGLMNVLHLEGERYGIRVNAIMPSAATRMTEGLLDPDAEHLLTPDAVAPGVLFLVSEDAPSRVILSAGAGAFARVYVTETEGISLPKEMLSPETIAERFDEISDRTRARTLAAGFDQTDKLVAAMRAHDDWNCLEQLPWPNQPAQRSSKLSAWDAVVTSFLAGDLGQSASQGLQRGHLLVLRQGHEADLDRREAQVRQLQRAQRARCPLRVESQTRHADEKWHLSGQKHERIRVGRHVHHRRRAHETVVAKGGLQSDAVVGVLRGQGPRPVQQIADGEVGATGQRMGNGTGQHQLRHGQWIVAQHVQHIRRQPVPVDPPHIAVEVALPEFGQHVVDHSGAELEAQLRALGVQPADGGGQEMEHDRRIGADPHHRRLIRLQLGSQIVEGGKPRAGPLQRQLSGRRKHHPARRALDKRGAQGVLEVLHHLRDRRLREIKGAANGPERPVAVDELQKSQVAQAQAIEMLGRRSHKQYLSH